MGRRPEVCVSRGSKGCILVSCLLDGAGVRQQVRSVSQVRGMLRTCREPEISVSRDRQGCFFLHFSLEGCRLGAAGWNSLRMGKSACAPVADRKYACHVIAIGVFVYFKAEGCRVDVDGRNSLQTGKSACAPVHWQKYACHVKLFATFR